MIDFFDHVRQRRSEYGHWLFDAAKVDAESMTFSEYMLMISNASTLSKNDSLRLIFNHASHHSQALSRSDWSTFIETMLSVEQIRHPKHTALDAFDRFKSTNVHGERVLYFEDFAMINQQLPFLSMPFFRLLTHIKRYHLGENFWRLKKKEIQDALKCISELG